VRNFRSIVAGMRKAHKNVDRGNTLMSKDSKDQQNTFAPLDAIRFRFRRTGARPKNRAGVGAG